MDEPILDLTNEELKNLELCPFCKEDILNNGASEVDHNNICTFWCGFCVENLIMNLT